MSCHIIQYYQVILCRHAVATGWYHTHKEEPLVLRKLDQLPATYTDMQRAFRLRVTSSARPRSKLTFFNSKELESAPSNCSIVAPPRGFPCFGTRTERACTPQSSSGATPLTTIEASGPRDLSPSIPFRHERILMLFDVLFSLYLGWVTALGSKGLSPLPW